MKEIMDVLDNICTCQTCKDFAAQEIKGLMDDAMADTWLRGSRHVYSQKYKTTRMVLEEYTKKNLGSRGMIPDTSIKWVYDWCKKQQDLK